MISCDVLVVGAGPVGTSLALKLAARDVDGIVAERSPSTSDEPKAISLDEALRIYQNAGVADRVLEVVVPGTGTRYFGAGRRPAFSRPFGGPTAARLSLQEPVRPDGSRTRAA